MHHNCITNQQLNLAILQIGCGQWTRHQIIPWDSLRELNLQNITEIY